MRGEIQLLISLRGRDPRSRMRKNNYRNRIPELISPEHERASVIGCKRGGRNINISSARMGTIIGNGGGTFNLSHFAGGTVPPRTLVAKSHMIYLFPRQDLIKLCNSLTESVI